LDKSAAQSYLLFIFGWLGGAWGKKEKGFRLPTFLVCLLGLESINFNSTNRISAQKIE
jgi:hypothetical protein